MSGRPLSFREMLLALPCRREKEGFVPRQPAVDEEEGAFKGRVANPWPGRGRVARARPRRFLRLTGKGTPWLTGRNTYWIFP